MSVADFVEKGNRMKADVWRGYIGPVVVLVTVLFVWSFFIGPWLSEIRTDLAFLRAARIQAIQQQMQQAQKAQAPDTK